MPGSRSAGYSRRTFARTLRAPEIRHHIFQIIGTIGIEVHINLHRLVTGLVRVVIFREAFGAQKLGRTKLNDTGLASPKA
jgi:hypothetical protein